MSHIVYFAALVSLLCSVPVSSAVDCHPCQGTVVPTPPNKPKRGGAEDTVLNAYAGMVTEVTKDSITIQWVNSSGEKPKKFPVSEALAAGKPGIEPRSLPGLKQPYSVMPVYGYRLTDVKVGDCVGIDYARIDGVDICDHICINRRPGGEVPPLPKEAEDLMDPREIWKAKNPGKPLPDFIAKKTYVPHHERMNAYWAKIAPMPPEAKPKSPNAKP